MYTYVEVYKHVNMCTSPFALYAYIIDMYKNIVFVNLTQA